jgi:hypothetical protein
MKWRSVDQYGALRPAQFTGADKRSSNEMIKDAERARIHSGYQGCKAILKVIEFGPGLAFMSAKENTT